MTTPPAPACPLPNSRTAKSQAAGGVVPVVAAVLGFFCGPICSTPILAAVLGLGSASLAVTLENYRWLFLILVFASIALGFWLNYIRTRAHWALKLLFWTSSLVSVLTVAHWGWWRIL